MTDALEHALGPDDLRIIPTGGDPFGSDREQWDDGNNVVCLEPGMVIGYDRKRRHQHAPAQGRHRGHHHLGSELGRGRGGSHCLTCPLLRDPAYYLRWAMLEATTHALRHPAYVERYQCNKRRLGRQRGAKVAQIDIARKLIEAIWHMLTNNQPLTPAAGGSTFRLAADGPGLYRVPRPISVPNRSAKVRK